jgi:cytochrome c oxidase assembly factor CtaG
MINTNLTNAPHVLGSTPLPSFADGARLWGLSVMDDQIAAGLIMWVPGNMIFFAAFMIVLYIWFISEEHKEHNDIVPAIPDRREY